MLIKICGITNLEDALTAVDAGAGALGFNFWPQSPATSNPLRLASSSINYRQVSNCWCLCERSVASQIAADCQTSRGRRVTVARDESPEYCAALGSHYVIKALAVGADFEPTRVLGYGVKAILLDAFDRKNRGGTGRTMIGRRRSGHANWCRSFFWPAGSLLKTWRRRLPRSSPTPSTPVVRWK